MIIAVRLAWCRSGFGSAGGTGDSRGVVAYKVAGNDGTDGRSDGGGDVAHCCGRAGRAVRWQQSRSLGVWRRRLGGHSGRTDDLPLQALPQFQQGRFFADQNPYVEPFKEIDNRPGFYAFAQWRLPRRLVVKAMHYDNLAKPTALEGGQYAWQTRFDALGVRTEVAGFELISQWMKGSTLMGSRWEATANFRSVFALVAKQFGEHRIALRYEDSLVRQFDNTPQDNNDETTDGLTVSYGWQINSHWQLQAEWQRQRTWRPGWMYANLTPRADEALWQLGLHWRSKRR